MEQPLSRAHHRQLYGMAFRLCALEQCTRSRDAECFRVHRTLSNTHSHMATCVRARTDSRRDISTGSAFGIGAVSPHFLSIFMRRPAWVKKRIEDARKHKIMRDTCRQFLSELSVVWDDVQKKEHRKMCRRNARILLRV